MRALCGAIITAGGLLGLGFMAIGIGCRYTAHLTRSETGIDSERSQILFRDLDNPMKLILVILVIGVIVGIGIAFLGLMYHHHRRHHELLHHHHNQQAGMPPRATV